MTILGHFGSYSAARQYAEEHHVSYFSIQHCGEGWQQHKWVLLSLS